MVEKESNQNMNTGAIEQSMPESVKPLYENAVKYKKQIIIALGIIVAVGVVSTGIRWYGESAKASAEAELGKILTTTEGMERIESLAKLAEDAPSSLQPAIYFELASLSIETKDYDKAAEYYAHIADDVDDETSVVATLGQTKALMLAGKADAAVPMLKKVAKTAPEGMLVTVNRQLALAAEQAGDTQTAIEALEALTETGSADKQFIEYKLSLLKTK